MPNDAYITNPPYVNLDEGKLKLGIDELEKDWALNLVTQTFDQYEQYRAQNHDPRWSVADGLYLGWLPGKVWEGTTIPRSALPNQIVFDQIEAALPAISQEIFVPQDEWFQVETEPGASAPEARQVQEHLSYVLEHSKNDYGLTAKNEIELAIKNTLLYGNGGIEITWDSLLNRAVVEWVDTRDFYIDPGCPIPNIDVSRAVIRRKFFTVDDLASRRDDPRMDIPTDDELYTMSKAPQFARGDQTKQSQEAIRGISYTPNVSDYAPNPADRKIEVLLFYSKARIIWVLNRQKVIYNEPNPYGFIPFCFAPCYTVPGRFYAQSVADVLEGDQRYMEALLNARLDALSLDLMPPRVYKRGVLMTPSQLRWRPGATYQADDAKDMALLQPTNQMANVYPEIGFMQDAAEKRTGINSTTTSGTPRPSNANRTATGVAAMSTGTLSRLRYLVANIENYLIVPMLYKLYTLVQMHTRPDQELTGLSKEGNLSKVSSNAFGGKMRFRMLASSKMMTREKLAQVFPFLTQYMVNGTFMGELHKSGKTIDFMELFQMLQDATGTGRLYNFIRPLSPEEQQAMKQPPPEAVADQQKTQAEHQNRLQLQQMKSQTDLQKAQIAAQPSPQELEQDKVRMQMDMEREQEKIKSARELAQIKAQAERDKHQMAMQGKQMELQGKQQEVHMNLQASQAQHQQEMEQMRQQGDAERSQQIADHSLGISQNQESHDQKMETMKQSSKVSLDAQRKKAQLKPKTKRT